MMNQETIQSLLNELNIPEVRWFDVIGSTNDEALDWLASGAPDGSLVLADTQTKGRGRLGRRWITQPGSALAASLIFTPSQEEVEHLALFSPLGALAISQALEEGWGLKPAIKWPNDVLLARRKAAGILVEVAWKGSHLQGLVIGLGLNISPASVPPDDEVLFPATSIEQAVGQPVDRFAVLRAVLKNLFKWRARLMSEAFLKAWEERLAFKNEWVRLDEDAGEAGGPAQRVSGVLTGIDPSGNLLLRLSSGEIKPISVGDVHLRPEIK